VINEDYPLLMGELVRGIRDRGEIVKKDIIVEHD